MDKLLIFPGRTDKGIFTYVIDAEKSHLEKTAAEYHPTIAAYINSAKPLPGKTQILLTALGAQEFWGVNANGDAFPETALAHEGPDYGYKTFELYAKAYKHHVNKDPTAAYGEVPLSVYNPVFHRVELIVSLDNERAPDIVQRIEQGDYPDWSMGARVPFDICSICGNKAPSRAYYCEHLKYYMGRIHPESGKMAYAINTMPKFFDISQVLIGADRIAKTLMKVASHGGRSVLPSSAYLAEKMAEADKKAAIVKEVPADSPPASQDRLDGVKDLMSTASEVTSREAPLPRELLDRFGTMPLPRVLSTMTMLGIVPKPQEFQRIYLVSTGQKSLADELEEKNLCFDPMSIEEPSADHFRQVGVSYRNFDDVIMRMLSPFIEGRSYAAPHLAKRITVLIKTAAPYPQPRFIKVSAEQQKNERKPFGPAVSLAAAAGLFAALSRKAPKEALTGIDKLLSTPQGVGVAAALGLGLINLVNSVFGPNVKGSYTPGRYVNPDSNNAHAFVEEMKQKPYIKMAFLKASPDSVGARIGAAGKRLLLGIPLAYMASGIQQKRHEIDPYKDEGRTRRFVRQNPDVISGVVMLDAYLASRGHGTYRMANSLAKKFAAQRDVLLKQADIQDVIGNALILPLAMGPVGLPGRIVGNLFDSAVIEGTKAYMNRRKNKDAKTS